MHIRIRPNRAAFCVLTLLAGAAFSALVWVHGVREERELWRADGTAQAEVREWRTANSGGVMLHELRYSFDAPGWPNRFTRSNPSLGREDLWAPVTPEAWEESKQSRRLDVRYVTADPRFNRPVATPGMPWIDALLTFTFGVTAVALAVGIALVAAMQYWRCLRRPAVGRREYLLFVAEPSDPPE